MKRTLLSLITALAVILPASLTQPSVASALSCPLWMDLLPFGVTAEFIGACSPFKTAPQVLCPITNVAAGVGDFQDLFLDNRSYHGDRYEYDMLGTCATTHVISEYDASAKVAQEELTENDTIIKVKWTCPDDAWIFLPGRAPTCAFVSANVQGESNATAAASDDQIEAGKLPLSVSVLSDVSRAALNGQLQNALKQQNTAPPKPIVHTGGTGAPVPTVPVGYADGWPFLSGNMQGEAVTTLEYLLRAAGTIRSDPNPAKTYTVMNFGEVRIYRQQNGLPASSWVDATMWLSLIRTVQAGDQGYAVMAVQDQLKTRGVDIVVDGNFGDQTNAAVQDFQNSHNLTVDGVVGPQTWPALLSAS